MLPRIEHMLVHLTDCCSAFSIAKPGSGRTHDCDGFHSGVLLSRSLRGAGRANAAAEASEAFSRS
jgi:hypothetical protein